MKGMPKLTKSLESATRKKIDQILINLGWNTDEESKDCNVFTERAKLSIDNKKFKGKRPDYVLYKSDNDNPIAIIEAKRKGQSIEQAIKESEELYAKPLGIKIIFAYDGAFFKSWHVEEQKELYVDGEPITQLVSERKLLRFLDEGNRISEITAKIKHTRAELIEIFRWANNLLRKEGLREGIERFTEFSNLLFLRLISELEDERKKNNEPRILDKQYSWESFCDLDETTMLNYINNTILPYLVSKYNHSGDVFQRELGIKNPKTLKTIVDRLSSINLMDADTDVKGDAFEYFLKTSITVGNDLGEYFTPRHIVKLIVELVEPKFGERIYDPTCGTGGFLIWTFNYIKQRCAMTKEILKVIREDTVFGRELTNTAKIAKMNMIITGDGHNNILQMDTLENPVKEEYDVVLANIPYGQTTDYGEYYPLPSTNADSVFLQHIMLSLKPMGRAAVVIPEGLLFRNFDLKLRKYLLENYEVESIISLPAGVFRPYAKGNKTDIIIFKKSGNQTKSIWFYDMKADGFDLESDLRPEVEENDIPDLLSKWNEKPDSANSWNVPIKTIKLSNYDLIAKSYKPESKVSTKNRTPFSKFLKLSKNKADIQDGKIYKQIRVKLHGKGAVLRREVLGSKIKTKSQYFAKSGQLIVSKIDARNGAIAVIPDELDGAIATSDFPLYDVDYSEIDKTYLEYYLMYNDLGSKLLKYSKGTTNRRRIKREDILNLTIEIPSLPEQKKIVDEIERERENLEKAKKRLEDLGNKIKA
jgi:type I restriction enzyme M protein